MHAMKAHDVIDVCVRDYDRRNLQLVAAKQLQGFGYIVARIDNNSFLGARVSNNMTIALQHTDGKNFVNKFSSTRHKIQYNTAQYKTTRSQGYGSTLTLDSAKH